MFTKPAVALNSRRDEKTECLTTCRKINSQEDSHLGLKTAQREMTDAHTPPTAGEQNIDTFLKLVHLGYQVLAH